jgi:hypothetical protein
MFITDLKAISPQLTYNAEFLGGEKTSHEDTVYHVIEPDYMEFIPKGLLRRMGKAVRMGVGAGLPLVKKHADLDGVIIGTANGGLEDCIKFLNQIVEYDEGTLTPTNFVQSTPNAVAGQLALMGENRGYNITYTNGGTSFENALLDALLLFEEGTNKKLLIGGIEEISDYNYNIDSLSHKYKKEIVKDTELIDSTTPGTVCGEGAALFVVENNADSYLAQIKDVAQITYPNEEDITQCLIEMLNRHDLKLTDIDSVMLGYNGDIDHNSWYEYIENALLVHSNSYSFKNLIGDYRTCTSFATWLATHMLNGETSFNKHIARRVSNTDAPKNILIYNHFDTVRHGFILMTK